MTNEFEAMKTVIAIDGPSGSGKGTVARQLAARSGFHLLDSGALYRLAAISAVSQGLDLETANEQQLAAIAGAMDIEFQVNRDGGECILLAGEEVTSRVREEKTAELASLIAPKQPVRDALFAFQRGACKAPGLIADGRDMGTVVFPEARLKVFLTASAEERARRRVGQLSELGINAKIDEICRDIEARDERDRNRTASPLVPAEDAVQVDTTDTPVDEVIALVQRLAVERGLFSL